MSLVESLSDRGRISSVLILYHLTKKKLGQYLWRRSVQRIGLRRAITIRNLDHRRIVANNPISSAILTPKP